jgi:hypothetical protein
MPLRKVPFGFGVLRYELQIGKLVAAAIERGARARHLTA